jgi:hypothetical protein
MGPRLPLLLPFAFLPSHFAENGTATIESALNAWLKVLGAKSDVLALLEEMLTDERLLLLVDGLDEWQNREAAADASCGARFLSPLAHTQGVARAMQLRLADLAAVEGGTGEGGETLTARRWQTISSSWILDAARRSAATRQTISLES